MRPLLSGEPVRAGASATTAAPPSERITAICGEKVRDTAKPGKRTTGLEPATFGLGSQRSYVGTALFGARAEATCDPPRSRSRRPSPAARSCNSKWAPQVRSGSDPTRVALPMLWLRRGSSVGQSTALVKRGSRVRIPSPAPRGPRCSSAPRQQSGVCHARSWPKKTAKSRLNGRKMRPDAGSASRWTFLTSEVLYQLSYVGGTAHASRLRRSRSGVVGGSGTYQRGRLSRLRRAPARTHLRSPNGRWYGAGW
jgi:hypothetical protein